MRREWVVLLFWMISAAGIMMTLRPGLDKKAFARAVQEEMNDKLQADSAFIARWNGNLDDGEIEKYFSESLFAVEIYNNNVLVWWNEAARQIPKYKEARYIVQKKDRLDVVLRTELDAYGGTRFFPLSMETSVQETSVSRMDFRGVTYDCEVSPSGKAIVSIWFWLILFFLTSAWAGVQYIKRAGDMVALWTAIVFLLVQRILLNLPDIASLLSPVSISKPLDDVFLLYSPLTFYLDTVLCWIAMYFLQSATAKKMIRRLPVMTQYIGFAFMLGSLFLYWNVIMRDMVAGGLFSVNVTEILFLNGPGFLVTVFFICQLVAGFASLYSLIRLAQVNPLSTEKKYLYLSAGIILTIPVLLVSQLVINPFVFYLFLIAVVLILDVYAELREQKLTYLLWWMLLFCGFMAAGFFHFGQLKARSARENFLKENFSSALPADINTVKSIKQTLDTSGIFLQMGNLEYPAKWDKDEIKGLLSGLLSLPAEKFDVELFDENGFSLFANHFGNYHVIKKSLEIGEAVGGNNLIFHPLHDNYYLTYEILPEKHPDGPWLFVLTYKHKQVNHTPLKGLSYALLKNGRVIDRNFETAISPSDKDLTNVKVSGVYGSFLYSLRENNMGYTMLAMEAKPGLLKPISIFSFLFALTGGFFILLTWLHSRRAFLPDVLPLKMGEKSSLKTRIQLSIIVLIIFSFIIVGAVTAFYFYNLIQANQSGKEREETQILTNTVIQESRNLENREEIIAYFYKNLLNLSYIHGKSLQLYDAQGKLLATSKEQPSEYMISYRQHVGMYQKAGFKKEARADGHFDYIALTDAEGQKAGYLGIQHQQTNISSRSILDFLGTILNVYIFLFLIAGVIAITIANSITQPIAILAEKLKQFKLGRSNEYLEWKSNDEIGTLITEYNNLNVALNRSAEMLAKTERDMAWREMAKQVAHEIKNPLTPMKLSIQYLEKTAKDDPGRASEMIPRVANTLIEQIDNLSQIAAEFSNFASMPQANNEKVALNDLVVTIHDLFRKRDDMDITLSTPIDDLVVFADKNHLVRILNNLVKNAIQAIPDGRRGKIDISLYQENNNAVVRVTDNGSGIPDAMKSKVFAPNFTTKSSGTGLGLAISANMIESFNGKIYFESEENNGTRFFIRIPLMKKEENQDVSRVSLEE